MIIDWNLHEMNLITYNYGDEFAIRVWSWLLHCVRYVDSCHVQLSVFSMAV